jgi:hypothetical protein
MGRRPVPIWRKLFPLGAVAVFGVLTMRGMTFYRGSPDPMQVVLGIALTFLVVLAGRFFCSYWRISWRKRQCETVSRGNNKPFVTGSFQGGFYGFPGGFGG